MPLLKDVAQYVRSKNAGPYWVTLDIFCGDDDAFDRIRRAPALGARAIAQLYGVSDNAVRIFEDRPLKVVKISFPRAASQGSSRDVDSHAGQYFVPLLDVDVS